MRSFFEANILLILHPRADMRFMEVYIGRQPILDPNRTVVGYELLFRSSQANFCDELDAAAATSQVIVNAVLGVGLDRLLGRKQAFINYDRSLLLGDWTTLLPPDKVVIEILESVTPDYEVLAACQQLRQQGYALALDDCADDARTTAFAPFVDILKVDFQRANPSEQAEIPRRYRHAKVKMVAEKVETEEEFERARKFGYDYFQGYFFARPTVLQAARIPGTQIDCLRLLKLAQQPELDFSAVEQLVRHDVGFSHSLLRYINSAAFHWMSTVESIRHALFLLGTDEIRKWAWMASLNNLGPRRPRVLIEHVLLRGRFCELIAQASRLALGGSDPFLLGMFSLLDAILRRPLTGILDDLNIGANLRRGLLGRPGESNPLARLLHIVKSYEAMNWREVEATALDIGLSADLIGGAYLNALTWVDAVLAADGPNPEVGRRSTGTRTESRGQAETAAPRANPFASAKVEPAGRTAKEQPPAGVLVGGPIQRR